MWVKVVLPCPSIEGSVDLAYSEFAWNAKKSQKTAKLA